MHSPLAPCIVGLSCRLPGDITDFQSAWNLFADGKKSANSSKAPDTRLESFQTAPSMRGGWIGKEGVEFFDADFFNIPSREAPNLRPNIRLGLELTHEALENAGIAPSTLRGESIAVCIGMGTEDGWDIKQWGNHASTAFNSQWAANSDPSGVSGHISRFFDFHGPCSNVSSACSSGAFALRDGIHAITAEGAEAAVVGAITTHFTPAPFAWAADTGVLSPTGKSAAFSAESDGYSPSEGAVFFIVKTLQTALRDNNVIYAVINSLVTGHNGHTRTLITPNAAAQIKVLQQALHLAGCTADDITFIEAHGTGTPIGDAIEVEALHEVYSQRKKPVFLSSSKTVLGHCHAAAAFAGVLKVLSCFENKYIPPHHYRARPNVLAGDIIIPQTLKPIHSSRIMAQVNTFGFTGSIATMIIENFTPQCPAQLKRNHPRYLLPFSAKTSAALQSRISQTMSWALATGCSLYDLAAILSLCRDHHQSYRQSYLVQSQNDLEVLKEQSLTSPPMVSAAFTLSEHSASALLNVENIAEPGLKSYLSLPSTCQKYECGNILDIAAHLYNKGHVLQFNVIYNKNDIDTALLKTFPLYPFTRQLCWPSNHMISAQGPATSLLAVEDRQTKLSQVQFEALLESYTRPLADFEPKVEKCHSPPRRFLVTGANGMIGSRLLEKLLESQTCIVYCIIRGEAWIRLKAAFVKFKLNTQILTDSYNSQSLHVMSTSDLCGVHFGLSGAEYNILLDNVDNIVHAAWLVNFNAALDEFFPFIDCTRNIVRFCLSSRNMVRIHFIGSYASTFNYPANFVPEQALEPNLSYSLMQGYAISKFLAEHMLIALQKLYPVFALCVIRVGQICGDTATGYWPRHEMMPMIISSAQRLRAVPRDLPDVTWVPSDICSHALWEAVTSIDLPHFHVLHIANPHPIPWATLALDIFKILAVNDFALLPWKEYVKSIQNQDASTPVSALLPYFINALQAGGMPTHYSSLAVTKTMHSLPSIGSSQPPNISFLNLLVKELVGQDDQKVSEPALLGRPVVFLFGPWSAKSGGLHSTITQEQIEGRLTGMAKFVSSNINVEVLNEGSPLKHQLRALSIQLAGVEHLSSQNVHPSAVIGYCFGEYAAAIAAGILSESMVVEILVHRASVVQHINGAMLTVFADIALVRKNLSRMKSAPAIAIQAGPRLIILSGSADGIDAARDLFHHQNIKTLLIERVIPFHSELIESSLSTLKLPKVTPKLSSKIAYISGMLGSIIPGQLLTESYWHRHMRSFINFHEAMNLAHDKYKGHTFLDFGPGKTLSKIIGRYDWSDFPLHPVTQLPSLIHPTIVAQKHLQVLAPESFEPSPTLVDVMLELLHTIHGHQKADNLLHHSFYSLGLQSLDYTKLSDQFYMRTGVQLPLSAFISDVSIDEILNVTLKQNQVVRP
ncbi:uncharacterized protein C8R40DRAFT_1173946 [Lentinula edodes]|uniref:uncharacterized protein n=1 Tax=Lentinula edodes TaxID=5353 RepID=UPI001E8E1B3E|nr:uncharacterized protein C8R40DRAFT_1173946 [Lentinula edodes]KAH7872216.1 hypothetical protein C8R40DRAFT_1173946 [Lentinula edodes]